MIIKQFARITTALILGGLAALLALAPAVMANPISGTVLAKEKNSSTLRQGIPGRRLGGGTRGEKVFSNAAESLIALTAPEALTITTTDNPKLLFYIPQMVSENTVEFVLLNDKDELVYEKSFLVSPEAGIISMDLQNEREAPILSLDNNYQWYFSIIPNTNDRANDVVVHGSIRKVDRAQWLAQQAAGTHLNEQLESAEPLEKVKLLYQQANLWQDAVALLDELHQADPENAEIANEWTQLLESVGLPSSGFQQPSVPVQIGLN